jgi:AraC family transcriptional regulator, exoenzyme S synthesis regulatory protein ExsA
MSCGELLVTKYDCPIDNNFQDIWSNLNYIVYIIEGRKTWHTSDGSYELQKDSCVLVRRGAGIVQQFFDSRFCLVIFFLPDEFICEVLKSKKAPIRKNNGKIQPVIPIDNTPAVQAFFHSMISHFGADHAIDPSLLELKFRELVLTITDNPRNEILLSYFCSLLNEPQTVTLQRVMEENYCFNLKLEEFARLASRSLSAFKRDFQKTFNTTPGKWLMVKRLGHARHLLTNLKKTVSEASFESGFENPSHFSRAFRQYFGENPVSIKLRSTV